jgi:hypothetical protein
MAARSSANNRDIQAAPGQGVIVDLSQHIGCLLNYEDIAEALTDEQETRLVDFVRMISKMSHDRISKRYDHWLEADRAHDVYVDPTATEFREKAVIGQSRAIADTVLTYQMAALTGRNPMFQLEGLNRDSRIGSGILERVLHQQMRRYAGEARIAQMLLDGIRYGFGPTKITWDAALNSNRIISFDPRRVFPDPRVQWGQWEDMQFCVFVSHASYSTLAGSGLYPKLKSLPKLRYRSTTSRHSWPSHRWIREEGRGLSIDPTNNLRSEGSQSFWTLGSARIADEAWIKLSGWEINCPGIDDIWLLVTIMDEEVVIRFQLNPYGRQIPAVFSSLHHDVHKSFGQSLYDILLPIHDIMTWLLRSRVDNVQAALTNLMFVDPTAVSVSDLIERNPWGVVRTLPGARPGEGVYIANVPDVTRGHWNDIEALNAIQQRVSAASDAQQGIPTADVRSATEIQRLTQLGSQRLGVLSRISSALTLRPAVLMMIENIQDTLRYEGSIKVDPNSVPSVLAPILKDNYIDFDIKSLQGDIDYLIVDGTLPIEPTRSPETWMSMLQVMNNTGLNMEYKTGRIAEEAIRAMGVPDLDQFRISQEERAKGLTPSQQISLLEKMRGATVLPDEQVAREREKGNIAPIQANGTAQ